MTLTFVSYLAGLVVCISGSMIHFFQERKYVYTRGQAGEIFWTCVGFTLAGFIPVVNLLCAALIIASFCYEYANKVFPNLKD